MGFGRPQKEIFMPRSRSWRERSAATAAIPLGSGASGVRAHPKVPAQKGIHKLQFALLVNGQEYPLATDPRMTLLDALHEEPISNRSK